MEFADGDLEGGFVGKGGTSSVVALNLFTNSLSDVWRFRAVLERLGVDLVTPSGDRSPVRDDAFCALLMREAIGDNLGPFPFLERGLFGRLRFKP